MASNMTYLITGANRGIGLGMTSALLLRPNTTVIATIRSIETSTEELLALSKASGSLLITVPITYTTLATPSSTSTFLSTLQSHNITKIDTIIANAGTSSFIPLIQTSVSTLQSNLETNTFFPLFLFQTFHSFLTPTNAKFILISSILGSITIGASEGDTFSYGMSKAAANYLVRKIHFDFPDLTAVAIHPGWVKTENGQKYAESLNYKEGPPMELEDCVDGVLKQIDAAMKKTTSGCFVGVDGKILPW